MADNNLQDTYIFKENIRHPSKTDRWITARDFAYSTKKSEVHYIENNEGTVSGVTLNAHSYNFNDQWVNSIDKIDKQAINVNNITPAPSGTIDQELLGTVTIVFSDIDDTSASLNTVTFTDNFTSYSMSGLYDNAGVITLSPTSSEATMPNLIPTAITTTVTPTNYIQNGDIVIVPVFNNDDILSLQVYDYYNSNTITVSGVTITPSAQIKQEFDYKLKENDTITTNNDILDMLNILNTTSQNSSNISLTDIWNNNSFNKSSEITITNTNNQLMLQSSTSLYGNGTILNRYRVPVGFIADYHAIICHNNNNDNYILRFNDSGQIISWYQINNFIVNNNTIDIQSTATNILSYMKETLQETSSFLTGWSSNINIDFTDETYSRFKPNSQVYIFANNLSFIKILKNTKNTILNKIVNANNTATVTVLNGENEFNITDNYPIDINNSLSFSTSLLTNNNKEIGNYEWTLTDNVFNVNINSQTHLSITRSNNSMSITFAIENQNTLFTLLDEMIKQEPLLPLTDIYFKLILSELNGFTIYNTTIANPRILEKRTILTPVSYGGIKNNLWNLIKLKNAAAGSPYINLDYNNAQTMIISYYNLNNEQITFAEIPPQTRIWFIDINDTNIIQTNIDDIYLISSNNIKVPAQFINLIAEEYTKIIIQSNAQINIQYNWHEYAIITRYYGADNQLLNVGDIHTPVYIRDGQFYPCIGLNDVEISTNDPLTTDAEIWIDTN